MEPSACEIRGRFDGRGWAFEVPPPDQTTRITAIGISLRGLPVGVSAAVLQLAHFQFAIEHRPPCDTVTRRIPFQPTDAARARLHLGRIPEPDQGISFMRRLMERSFGIATAPWLRRAEVTLQLGFDAPLRTAAMEASSV